MTALGILLGASLTLALAWLVLRRLDRLDRFLVDLVTVDTGGPWNG